MSSELQVLFFPLELLNLYLELINGLCKASHLVLEPSLFVPGLVLASCYHIVELLVHLLPLSRESIDHVELELQLCLYLAKLHLPYVFVLGFALESADIRGRTAHVVSLIIQGRVGHGASSAQYVAYAVRVVV